MQPLQRAHLIVLLLTLCVVREAPRHGGIWPALSHGGDGSREAAEFNCWENFC